MLARLPAAGTEVAREAVSAVAARAMLGTERGGHLAAYLADVEGAPAGDDGMQPFLQPRLGHRGQDAPPACHAPQAEQEEGEEDESRLVVQRDALRPTEPQQQEQQEDLPEGDAPPRPGLGRRGGVFQQFLQRGHDAAVGIAGQLVGGGDAVGDARKVHARRQGAVADVEHVRLLHAQLRDGMEQSLGVGLGAGDVLAAHHDVQEVRGQVLVHGVVDAEAVLGGDDAHLGVPFLQPAKHVERLGEEAGVGCHVHVGFLAVLLLEVGQAGGVGLARQDGERFFQRLADGAADGIVRHVRVAVALQHVAEAQDDAARRVGQGVVEVEEVGSIVHGCLLVHFLDAD